MQLSALLASPRHSHVYTPAPLKLSPCGLLCKEKQRLGQITVTGLVQDVTRELAFSAPLCAHISTPENFSHAHTPGFQIRECHIEIRNALTQLHNLATSPLAQCLRSITLSDWSVVHSGILLWIQTAANEGERCSLEKKQVGLIALPAFFCLLSTFLSPLNRLSCQTGIALLGMQMHPTFM